MFVALTLRGIDNWDVHFIIIIIIIIIIIVIIINSPSWSHALSSYGANFIT